jgi:hypothetical protein
VFGAASAIYAAVVTMLVAVWTGMLHTVVPLALPASLRKVSVPELAVLRRRCTGIPLFGLVLRRTPLRHLGGAVYLAKFDNDPARVRHGIQDAEAIHVWSLLFCTPWLAFWCWRGWWFSVGLSLAVHLFLNLYPILHLRFTRGRMERCAGRLARINQPPPRVEAPGSTTVSATTRAVAASPAGGPRIFFRG